MQRWVLVCAMIFGACSSSEDATETEAAQPTEPAVAESGLPEPELMAPQVKERAYVTSISSLRKAATDERRIDDPSGESKKKISNWVATLYRGEEVTILEIEGDWARLQASDESEGWMNKKYLVRADDVEMATITEEVQVFRRPDLLALNSGKKLEAGSLLYVKRTKDQFVEINYSSNYDTWVLGEKLLKDPLEVSAAKLIAKIRYLEEKKDESAKELIALAKSQFGQSKLIALLNGDEQKAEEAQPAAEDGAKAAEPEAPSVEEPAAEKSN